MLEVVFDEAVKGSMMLAKSKDKKKSIAGKKEDVVSIGFSFDIGDISGKIDSLQRQEVFRRTSGLDSTEAEVREFFIKQCKELEKLLSSAKNGHTIRIWKGNAPFSVCAFAFVCHKLKNIDCEIKVVSLPKHHKISRDTIVSYSSWAEIPAEEFHKFLSLEKDFSEIEKTIFAYLWEELKEENAPLRALVNGKLISVPEDFYDHLIIKNIPDGEFSKLELIGEVLGKYGLGVGDSWFDFRIDKLIEENKLEVLSRGKRSNLHKTALRKLSLKEL